MEDDETLVPGSQIWELGFRLNFYLIYLIKNVFMLLFTFFILLILKDLFLSKKNLKRFMLNEKKKLMTWNIGCPHVMCHIITEIHKIYEIEGPKI